MTADLEGLRSQLESDDKILRRVVDDVCARSWQLRARDDQLRMFTHRLEPVLRSLTQALRSAERLELGGPEFREAVQLFSFFCGWTAGERLAVAAPLGVCHALERQLGGKPPELFHGLQLVAMEAYAAGLEQQAQARHRQVIEKSQVVCALSSDTVALFLVGDPDRQALDEAIGRLMMLAVMREARAIVLDGSGLLAPDSEIPRALDFLADHRAALLQRRTLVTGVPKELVESKSRQLQLDVACHAALDDALVALGLAGT